MKNPIAIKTVSDLSTWDFSQNFFHKNTPVIIQGAMRESKVLKNWSHEYLKQKIGEKQVDIITSVDMDKEEKGNFNYNKPGIRTIKLPFDQIANLLTSDQYKKGEYYLAASSIPDCFPELLPDLETPTWNSLNDVMVETNLWFGCAGCIAHLHFDNAQNFLFQVMGSKELLLFSPEDTPYLYQDINSNHPELSKVNLQSIDQGTFPLIENAQPYHCILNPGDLLFLPLHWWHQVKSLNASISINFWWHRYELIQGSNMAGFDKKELKAIVREFLSHGIKIDQPDYEGESMLVKAVIYGYPNVVDALLSLGADPLIKSTHYEPGASAWSIAMKKGNQDIIQLLQQYTVDFQA